MGERGADVNPSDLRYHAAHGWARLEGDTAVFGITDYAQGALGDIVYVELPEVGTQVTAGEAFAEVESVKTVSDVVAPMSGPIIEVNDVVVDAPETLNKSPYGDGWLVKVALSQPAEETDLMSATEYEQMLARAAG